MRRNETVAEISKFLSVSRCKLRLGIKSIVGADPIPMWISRVSRQGAPLSRLAKRTVSFLTTRSRCHVFLDRLYRKQGQAKLALADSQFLQNYFFLNGVKKLKILIGRDLQNSCMADGQ